MISRRLFLALALAALGLALSCAKARADSTFTFTLRLPAREAAAQSCTDDSTGAALTDLKWLKLCVRRLGSHGGPDTTVADSLDVAGKEGQELTFPFTVADDSTGTLEILIPRAVDHAGNQSCVFAQRMIAVPARAF